MQPTTFVFDTLNNKFPCEGPRVVQCVCDFSSATSFDIDLKTLVQQGKISEVQSLFVDNADNPDFMVLVMSASNQRIIVPAYSQAYLTVLLNQAQLSATTASPVKAAIFAQNFPVQNCVWSAPANGAAASNVAVTNFPTVQMVALSPTATSAFTPTYPGINLTTGAASVNSAIVTATGQNIRITNTGAAVVFIRTGSGTQTALATDLSLAPNQSIIINANGANNIAAISPAGASSVNIIVGYGE